MPYKKKNRWRISLVSDKRCVISNIMTLEIISYSLQTWVSAVVGAALVGCIGLLPIFIVPDEEKKSLFH